MQCGLNVAKCHLGKVNFEAMLVSSFPNAGGGPMPIVWAPRDLYTRLLASLGQDQVSVGWYVFH